MIIISTSSTIAQIVVGRFVLGVGIAVMTVAAPAYSIEVAPPHWRGRCPGFYNCGWFGGSIPAAIITYGTNYIDSDYSWRIPLILQAFSCIIVIVSVFFIPESPRWLMANGREDEAVAVRVFWPTLRQNLFTGVSLDATLADVTRHASTLGEIARLIDARRWDRPE